MSTNKNTNSKVGGFIKIVLVSSKILCYCVLEVVISTKDDNVM